MHPFRTVLRPKIGLSHSFLHAAALAMAIIATVGNPSSPALAVALQTGDLVLTETRGGNGNGIILRVNPNTGAQTTVASGGFLSRPTSVLLDPTNSTLIVSDFGDPAASTPNGSIFRIDPVNGQQTLIATGGNLTHPLDIAFDAVGNIVVVQQVNTTGDSAVLKVNPLNGIQTPVTSGNALWLGLAVESTGNYLVSQYGGGAINSAILRINAVSGAQTAVSLSGDLNSGPERIWLNITKPSSLLVPKYSGLAGGKLLDVNTVTGAQTIISSGGLITGGLDVTQSLDGKTYMTDLSQNGSGPGNILEINLTTGAQTTVSSGGLLQIPTSILVVGPVPEPASLAILSTGALALLRRKSGLHRRSG